MKKVIYTAIFGGYDTLKEPRVRLPDWDFICFSDQQLSSNRWEVRTIDPPVPGDMVRSARKVKILAHEFLSSYDVSIWVDGNIKIRGDVNELLAKHLSDNSLAVYNHKTTDESGRKGVYEEARALIKMTEAGKYKADPNAVKRQVEKYRQKGYPEENGLAVTSVLLRKHNDPSVKEVMEDWWGEVKEGSRRDQLSFNYAAWKHDFDFKVIEENGWSNKCFKRVSHHVPWYRKPKLYFNYILKRLKNYFYE